MNRKEEPYDTHLETCGKERMARFLRACVLTHSYFTCSFFLGKELDPYTSIQFRMWVPPGREDEFEKLSGCELKHPARVGVPEWPMPVVPCDACKGMGREEITGIPGSRRFCSACWGSGEETNELKRKLVLEAKSLRPGCFCKLCQELRQRRVYEEK